MRFKVEILELDHSFQVYWVLACNEFQLEWLQQLQQADGFVPKSLTAMLESYGYEQADPLLMISFLCLLPACVGPSVDVLLTVFVRPANIGTTP